jgi:hypothetical protein
MDISDLNFKPCICGYQVNCTSAIRYRKPTDVLLPDMPILLASYQRKFEQALSRLPQSLYRRRCRIQAHCHPRVSTSISYEATTNMSTEFGNPSTATSALPSKRSKETAKGKTWKCWAGSILPMFVSSKGMWFMLLASGLGLRKRRFVARFCL